MDSNPWLSTKTTNSGWEGNCPEHGEWQNYIRNLCVYEDWEQERRKPKVVQQKLWSKV